MAAGKAVIQATISMTRKVRQRTSRLKERVGRCCHAIKAAPGTTKLKCLAAVLPVIIDVIKIIAESCL
jgi:hypothetical protein